MLKKISVPFVEFGSRVPLIEFKAGDVPFVALVDTGSETTLFDPSVADKGKLNLIDTGKTMCFVGIGGEQENSNVYALHEEFLLSGNPVDIFGVQSDLSAIRNHFSELYGEDRNVSAVFGSDFLDAYGAVLNFDEHMMHLYCNDLSSE